MREHRSVDHGPMYSDHHGLELLSEEECVELLRTKTVGRIGLSASSLPFVLPVRYVVDDGGSSCAPARTAWPPPPAMR
jgi:hypothetical protein